MAIIVGDIHGNLEKARRFLAYRPDQPHVALGDYVDSFHEPIEAQVATVELLGELFDGLLQQRRLVAAHWVDGWLCTHAGFAEGGNGLTPQGCCRANSSALADCINRHFYACLEHEQSSPLFNIPVARGGDAPYGGIFWLDPFREKVRLDPSVRQIFGHTEQPRPVVTERWICLDTTNSDDIWIYDTETAGLVNLMNEQELKQKQAQRHRAKLAQQAAFNGGV